MFNSTFCCTGILFYTIGSELFSSSGSTAVYGAAFKRCINDIKVRFRPLFYKTYIEKI